VLHSCLSVPIRWSVASPGDHRAHDSFPTRRSSDLGVEVVDERFAGGTFDWFTPYTLLVAAGLVCGYALLGAAWLMWKTADELHGDARRWAVISGVLTALFLVGVSLSTLVVQIGRAHV